MGDNTKKERNTYYDFVRICAMFMVIGVHAVGSIKGYASSQLDNIIVASLEAVNGLGVPIFFALSGRFLISHNFEGTGLAKWYLKHFKRILIPYCVYGLVYVIYFTGIEQHNIMGIPKMYVYDLLFTGFHNTHWFIYSILGLYIATPFLSKMFHNMNDKEVAILLGSALGINILCNIFSLWGLSLKLNDIIFNQSGVLWYILGYSTYRLRDKLSIVIKLRWLLMLIAIAGRTLFTGFNAFSYMFVIAVMMEGGMNNLPDRCKKIISFVSRYSYDVYLIHAAVISLVIKLYSDWSNMFALKVTGIYFVVWIVSMAIVYIPGKCMQRIMREGDVHGKV